MTYIIKPNKSLHHAADEAAIETMKKAGVEVIKVDIEPFREPMLKAMNEYIKTKGPEVYAVYQKMLDVAKQQ